MLADASYMSVESDGLFLFGRGVHVFHECGERDLRVHNEVLLLESLLEMEDEVRTAEILVRRFAGIVLAFLKAFSGKYRLKEILPEASLHLRLSCQRFRKCVGLSSYIRCLLLHFLHGLFQLLGKFGTGLQM